MACKLRILSGKHEGAELPLMARRYSLGSGEDNSLILSDDAIAEHHLSFFFADGELSVLSASGGLRIDGKQVESYPVDVAPFQVLTLAGEGEKDNISLAYGDEEKHTSKDTQSSASDDASENSTGGGTNLPSVQLLKSWPDHERIAALLAKGGTKGGTPQARLAEKKLGALARLSPKRRKILMRSSLTLAALAALAVILFIAGLLWLNPTRQQAARMRQVESSLAKELEAKPVAERTVHISEGQNGNLSLTGYVETEKELVRLRGLAFESGLQIRVISKEQLYAALQVIGRQYGLFATFQLHALDKEKIQKSKVRKDKIPKGKIQSAAAKNAPKDAPKDVSESSPKQFVQHFHLRLDGFIEHERQLEIFREAVRQDLPYITQIDSDVTTSETLLSSMRELLSYSAAFSGVELALSEGQLLLSGAIFADFHDELRSLLQQHHSTLPYPPLTKDRLTLVPPMQADITALLLGRQRAVELRLRKESVAKRYRIGESIDNKILLAIASNGILLSYLDQPVGFPISTPLASAQTQQKNSNPNIDKSEAIQTP